MVISLQKYQEKYQLVNYPIVIFHILDIFINLNTVFITKEGDIEENRKKIWNNYKKCFTRDISGILIQILESIIKSGIFIKILMIFLIYIRLDQLKMNNQIQLKNRFDCNKKKLQPNYACENEHKYFHRSAFFRMRIYFYRLLGAIKRKLDAKFQFI